MDKPGRKIRSYVRREGRMTAGQKRALEHYWSRYGIDYRAGEIDLDAVFGRPAPKILDIGPGMGDATVAMAQASRENDYLAVETHRPGVGSLLRQAAARKLTNIRVISHDVCEVLAHMLPANSLDGVCIFFPDPWPKKRHHKRRLINHEFLNILKPRLKENARIYIATDWQDYAEQILEVFETHAGYINLAGEGRYSPRPRWRPYTKFESKGRQQEHPVRDCLFACRPG